MLICSGFISGFVQVGYNPGRPGQSVQMDLDMAQVRGEAEIWRRFGPESRSVVHEGNSMHGMQIAQRLAEYPSGHTVTKLVSLDVFDLAQGRCSRERARGPGHSILDGLRDVARVPSGICDRPPKWGGR